MCDDLSRRLGLAVLIGGLLCGAGLPSSAAITDFVIELCESTGTCDGADIRFQGDANAELRGLGFSMAIGHVNGDSLEDLVVGSPGAANGAGTVYVFYGREDSGLAEDEPNRGFDLTTANVTVTAPGADDFGFSVGIAALAPGSSGRVIVGAPAVDNPLAAGQVFVIDSGALTFDPGTPTSITLDDNNSFSIAGENAGDQFGYSVAVGPVLTPNSEDFVIGAKNRANAAAEAGAGAIYAIAETPGPVDLATDARVFEGAISEGVGEFLAIADFGARGRVAASAVGVNPAALPVMGQVYVVDFTQPNPVGTAFIGEQESDLFGFSLAAGNFSGGAANDLAVGAILYDRDANSTNNGAVFVIEDVATATPGTIVGNASVSQTVGFRGFDQLGFAVAIGEVDGATGFQDLIFTARLNDRDQTMVNQIDEGAAYIVFGGNPLPANVDCGMDNCAMAPPTGIDVMLAGGDYGPVSGGAGARSDEAGFALAVGDFDREGDFAEIAVSSLSQNRVYLVSINDHDSDLVRDLTDQDDDNDGVDDIVDLDALDENVCQDADGDSCDDCSQISDAFGPGDNFDPANDGADFDADGACDLGDTDDDNDGVPDIEDVDPLNENLCRDLDGDGCDDCSQIDDAGAATPNFDPANDGADFDGDGLCNLGDPDDDNDGVNDAEDTDDFNENICRDLDVDTCDDCSQISDNFDPAPNFDTANDGLDTDADGLCNDGDIDDDGDTVVDAEDNDPLDPTVCRDVDADFCDDCVSGTDDPTNDGPDLDNDGQCDDGDPDTDGDGVNNPDDSAPTDPNVCRDVDMDTCDDCSSGSDDPPNDGVDTDGDVLCDLGDPDDDNDGVLDGDDNAPLNPNVCRDLDADTCDDCSSGTDDPANDGLDTDGDGQCDAGDADDDGDGVGDLDDSDPLDPNVCRDVDLDTCDDCTNGSADIANDGLDTDGDGVCDLGDTDDDNDFVPDADDNDPTDPTVCRDVDADSCDDCSSGADDAANDGLDSDADGLCDQGDPDDDNDGVADGDDADPTNPNLCRDVDLDTCDDCSSGADDPANDGFDFDGDGLCDAGDPDTDNDGVPNGVESAEGTSSSDVNDFLDSDGDMTPDFLETDADNDGTSNADESGGNNPYGDNDGDGTPDYLDADDRGDGMAAACSDTAPANGICDNGAALDPIFDPNQDGTPEFQDALNLTGTLPSIENVDAVTVSWSPVAAIDMYHLYRGDLDTLRASGAYVQEPSSHAGADRFCGITDTSFDDPYQPQVGETVFYLVTTESGGLGSGSGGQRSENGNCN